MFDIKYMKKALVLAKKAAKTGEVPVGAVIVHNGIIISQGYNKREIKQNALMHAEIIAIDKACKKLGSWRLCECELYVTLEPCPMCTGAIINSRIERIYFGAFDPKAGALGSVCNLSEMAFNHHFSVEGGIMANECGLVLSEFFRNIRERRNVISEKNE